MGHWSASVVSASSTVALMLDQQLMHWSVFLMRSLHSTCVSAIAGDAAVAGALCSHPTDASDAAALACKGHPVGH